MRPSSCRRAALLAATGLIALAAGCDSDSSASTFAPPHDHADRPPGGRHLDDRRDDPQDSANADIGAAIRSSVGLAETMIDAAGGVNSQPIRVIPVDESVSGLVVDPAFTELLDDDVDAIVGPASSIDALASLGEIVDAGVVACSPTASSALLDNFPDDGLFFRTIPSDSLQAVAIADAVNNTGATQATVVYIDDDYGQLFNESVAAALRRGHRADRFCSVLGRQRVDSRRPGTSRRWGAASWWCRRRGLGASHARCNRRCRRAEAEVRRQRRDASSIHLGEPMGVDLANRIVGISPPYSTNGVPRDLGATPDNRVPTQPML
jgi:hypothetical protein